MRVDKWLWAARFFKTRALASKACELGRIELNGQRVKPAREVRVNDRLRIRNESGEFRVDVLMLSEMRGPAPIARTLYRETEESVALHLELAEQRRAMHNFESMREGRPSKRDRRQIEQFRRRT